LEQACSAWLSLWLDGFTSLYNPRLIAERCLTFGVAVIRIAKILRFLE
jgi:hypothetical protein